MSGRDTACQLVVGGCRGERHGRLDIGEGERDEGAAVQRREGDRKVPRDEERTVLVLAGK